MNVLSVRTLHKSYGTRVVFEGVDFAVAEGEKVGFIGANGSGKSTLFRIVAGVEGVASGEVAVQKGVRVGYLPQEPEFEPDDTIRQAAAGGNPRLQKALVEYRDIAEKLAAAPADPERLLARQAEASARIEEHGGWDWEHRVEAMLTRLGVEAWERPVDQLSGGERKRVALARTLLAAPELLLLDEPTNHLDADTVLWLEEFLVDYPGAVLLITHDRYFLDRVVDRMIEVSIGELVPYAGGYTDYLEERAARDRRAAVEEGKRVRLIEKELEWARRAPPARTGKQKARIRRVKELEQTQRRRDALPGGTVAIETAAAPRLGRTVVDLEGISKAFGDRALIRDFSTMLRGGERVGVIGPNGAGKTTLLRIILGEEAPDAGRVKMGETTRIAYFDQARADLDPDASIYEATADTDWVTVGERKMHLRAYLENFLFPTAIQQQKVRSLSGGERNRLLLARLFLQESNLLILDEPTNDLDLVTLRVLEEAILDYPGCVLVVTHDRYVLDRVATALLAFEGDGVVRRHEGGYDRYRAYREKKEAEEAALRRDRERKEKERRSAAAPPAAKRPGLSWKEKKELEALESEIEAAERERDETAARLADPALYAGDPAEAARMGSAFRDAETRVERLYDRWATLEERGSG